MVYDITSRSSFENVEGWLSELRQHSEGDMVVILVNVGASFHPRSVTSAISRISVASPRRRPSPAPGVAATRRAIGIPATPVACRFDMNRNDLSEVRLPPGLIFLPLWDNLATKTFFNCEVAHHE